jgi:hypothetical protein
MSKARHPIGGRPRPAGQHTGLVETTSKEGMMPRAQGGLGDVLTVTIGDGREAGRPAVPVSASSEDLEVSMWITVGLVRMAAADLTRTRDRSGLSQTDIVNRALTLYEFIDAELSDGAELYMRRDGHQYVIKLLSTMRRKAAPRAGRRRMAPP